MNRGGDCVLRFAKITIGAVVILILATNKESRVQIPPPTCHISGCRIQLSDGKLQRRLNCLSIPDDLRVPNIYSLAYHILGSSTNTNVERKYPQVG